MPTSNDNEITRDPLVASDLDLVTISHPLLPGEESQQPRASLPAWVEVGWSEVKSPSAKTTTLKEGPK